MAWYYMLITIYLIIISIIAIILTVYDKHASKINSWRISENTLLLTSCLGGSVAMFITMKIIRHKTRHYKFMIGIPVIIVLQLIAVICLCYWVI